MLICLFNWAWIWMYIGLLDLRPTPLNYRNDQTVPGKWGHFQHSDMQNDDATIVQQPSLNVKKVTEQTIRVKMKNQLRCCASWTGREERNLRNLGNQKQITVITLPSGLTSTYRYAVTGSAWTILNSRINNYTNEKSYLSRLVGDIVF